MVSNKRKIKYRTKKKRLIKQKGAAGTTPENLNTDLDNRLNFFKNDIPAFKKQELFDVVNYIYKYEGTLLQELLANLIEGKKTEATAKNADEVKQIEDKIKTVLPNGIVPELEKYTQFSNEETSRDTFNKNMEKWNEFCNAEGGKTMLEWSRKTCLTVINMHGALENNEINFLSFVPSDTIICFLGPIDNVLQVKMEEGISSKLNSLKFNDYQEIFKKHMNIRNIGFGYENYHSKFYSFYNCFADSMWYYPGQVYPNLGLELTHEDYQDKESYNGVHFTGVNPRSRMIHEYLDDKFHSTTKMDELIKEKKSKVGYKLKDIVDYPKYRNRFRVIFVVSCRVITFNDSKTKKAAIYLEILSYHLNNRLYENKDLQRYSKFQALCSNYSTKRYIYFFTDEYTQYAYNKFSTNLNLDSKVPNLQLIKKKFHDEKRLENSEYNYLCGISFKKLFYFLQLFENRDDKNNLIRNLLINNSKQLNELFKKFINVLENYTYYKTIGEDLSYHYDTINYMINFKDLLVDTCPILSNSIIVRNIQIFQDEYNIIQQSNILPESFFLGDEAKPGRENIIFTDENMNLTEFVKEEYKDAKIFYSTDTIYTNNAILPNIKKVVLGKGTNIIRVHERDDNKDVMEYLNQVFPNCQELVFKSCFLPTFKTELSVEKKTFRNLIILKIINTEFEIDNLNFNFLAKLEYLEISNNSKIKNLILKNPKLKTLVLRDLSTIEILQTPRHKLETLELHNINPDILKINLYKVKEFYITECNFVNARELIIRPKSMEYLKLEFCEISKNNLMRMIPETKLLFGPKKLKSLILNFVTIRYFRSFDKSNFIQKLKNISEVTIQNMKNNVGELIKFTNTDCLKNVNKKQKIRISRENYDIPVAKDLKGIIEII